MVLQVPTRRARPASLLPIRKFGFATKREAEDAEAQRRIEEQQKYELGEGRRRCRRPAPEDAVDAAGGVLPPARREEAGAQDHRAVSRAGGVPRSGTAEHAARRDHAAAPQSRMEPLAPERRSHTSGQDTAPAVRQRRSGTSLESSPARSLARSGGDWSRPTQ